MKNEYYFSQSDKNNEIYDENNQANPANLIEDCNLP